MSIKKSPLPHKFIIKFIHGCLPIGNMMHRYHTKYEAKCPSCLHKPEDINHFLQCPTHQEWKTSMYARLVQYFTHMSTQLANLLQECLRQWLHTDSPVFLNTSPRHTKLLTQQAQIRWDQLFQGQFSKQWSIIQHDYISWLQNPPEGYSAQTWLCGIILIIWEHIHQNWISRNEDQHGHDMQSHEDHKYAQAQHETSDLYH